MECENIFQGSTYMYIHVHVILILKEDSTEVQLLVA